MNEVQAHGFLVARKLLEKIEGEKMYWSIAALLGSLPCFFAVMQRGRTKGIFSEAELSNPRCEVFVAGIFYLVCVAAFFYPLLRNPGQCLIGPPSDNMQSFWNLWWGHKAIVEHAVKLSFSDFIFFPEGTLLFYHTFSFYNLLLSLGLRLFCNPALTYNLLVLHSFLLAGVGAFLLINYLMKNSYLALIGGYIFAFNPSHFAHSLYHLNIVSIQFIPFFVLSFIKLARGGSKGSLLFSCLFFLLSALCDWNYLVMNMGFMALAYMYLVLKRKTFCLGLLFKIGTILGTTLLILAPWLLPMVWAGLTGRVNLKMESSPFVADMAGFFLPHAYHFLGQFKFLTVVNGRYTGNPWEAVAYLGLINLGIVLITLRSVFKEAAKYFLGLLAFLVLSMGSVAHLAGRSLPLYLPYKIIAYIPFVSQARCPSRFIVYAYLFLAIIVCYSLRQLIASFRSRPAGVLLTLLLSALIVMDYYSVCHQLTRVEIPSCYGAITEKGEGKFGILNLPVVRSEDEARYMMYQTFVGLPMVNGYVSRKMGGSLMDRLEVDRIVGQKKQLKENNVKYVVLHKDLLRGKNEISLEDYARFYKQIYEDDRSIVYQVY